MDQKQQVVNVTQHELFSMNSIGSQHSACELMSSYIDKMITPPFGHSSLRYRQKCLRSKSAQKSTNTTMHGEISNHSYFYNTIIDDTIPIRRWTTYVFWWYR